MSRNLSEQPTTQPLDTEEAVRLAVQAASDKKAEEIAVLDLRDVAIAEWILMVYGDFIVHVFSAASRHFYDLERLWRDAKRLEVAV